MPTNPSADGRFWSWVAPPDANGCRLWKGRPNKNGRGRFVPEGSPRGRRLEIRPEIWVWEQEHGPIPEGQVPSQKCGHRLCVEVNHMRLVPRKAQRPRIREGMEPGGPPSFTTFPPLGEWAKQAACRPSGHYADVSMFPPTDTRTKEERAEKARLVAAAKAVCAVCPVRAECLADALALPSYEAVIAGGLTDDERFKLRNGHFRQARRQQEAADRKAAEAESWEPEVRMSA